ncbi:hypothetical protein CIPAW_01G214600 [Carya illinoinensis]|uniref:Acyl carrier protein n=1 Tax=Carya illinoinensis TaxID=32201 RepID=A0A8T1RQM3_CARIL|nr:hypothetical protein CIPAW_01G214600 [Carya illinoinensis]
MDELAESDWSRRGDSVTGVPAGLVDFVFDGLGQYDGKNHLAIQLEQMLCYATLDFQVPTSWSFRQLGFDHRMMAMPRPPAYSLTSLYMEERQTKQQICISITKKLNRRRCVQGIIAKQLSIDESTVTPHTKFADLGADSLDTVEIMMALEEKFEVSIGGGAENISTVQDAADLIEKVKVAAA